MSERKKATKIASWCNYRSHQLRMIEASVFIKSIKTFRNSTQKTCICFNNNSGIEHCDALKQHKISFFFFWPCCTAWGMLVP